MKRILMLMRSILTALIIIAWHRGLQRIVTTLVVRLGRYDLPSDNLVLLRKVLALHQIAISIFALWLIRRSA